jgi:hypothetical protein
VPGRAEGQKNEHARGPILVRSTFAAKQANSNR